MFIFRVFRSQIGDILSLTWIGVFWLIGKLRDLLLRVVGPPNFVNQLAHCKEGELVASLTGVFVPSLSWQWSFATLPRYPEGRLSKRGRLVESQPSSAQSPLSKAIVGVVGVGKWPKLASGRLGWILLASSKGMTDFRLSRGWQAWLLAS
jgi:hypothetical protein